MKKILISLLFTAVAVLAARAETRYQGDINLDGSVDGNDVSILLEMVLTGGVSDAQMVVADINTDGSVDGNDVSILLEIVLTGSPTALYEYETFTVAGTEFTMVKVPGGTFTMGATAEQGSDAYGDELPTHSVTLSSFMIGQTEVTQELWNAVMGSNPSYYSGTNFPVEQVNWDDCQEFIAQLNSLLSNLPEMEGKAFRLPTEAEWEYAARGAQTGGTKYAGSDDIDDVAWYWDNSSSQTHPVGTKRPNALGLYDMTGNVWEWCQDWYGLYSSEAQTDPQGPASGTNRVMRGGSWSYVARNCRVSYRKAETPTYNNNRLGLRLVLADDPTAHLFTVNGVKFTMKEVPGGTFTMGATAEQGSDAYGDELPTHSVTLSSFMIGQTEVTQELWNAVMGSNPSYYSGTNFPVEQVNWDDCQEFIAQLNSLLSNLPEMEGKAFRLPTEAEWEYAARGAQTGGTKYAGSDDIDDVAWYRDNSESTTHPVGTKQPNALRLYDMTGNVWEWCQDWYGKYSSTAQTDPQGPASGTYRIARGGCWNFGASVSRVSYRNNYLPSFRNNVLGLRLVLAEDPSAHVFTVNGVKFTMKEVPGSTFTMGATAEQGSDAYGDELPTHSVTLSSFMIGQTEVTQELWNAVMGSNPSYYSGTNFPVEQVNWDDCQEFIAQLNSLLSNLPEMEGKAFRLPTEAEWEYAARGAQTGGTKYAGSDDIDDVAWYRDNSESTTHPVGTKQPNALRLYDMTGNVWEWCQDWYGKYSSTAQTDPQGPASGTHRLVRGGCWNFSASSCRVSCRSAYLPSYRNNVLGLRLVLADEPKAQQFTANGVSFAMVKVPGGKFTIGATSEQGSDAHSHELPTHNVTLSTFMIGQTEVTQELWIAVMGSNPCYFGGSNLPVENVSWNDCQRFVAKLNSLLSNQPEMEGKVFRLPTEAEWEYAARGGASGGTKYAGSDNIDDVAWYSGNSSSTTHPVATKQPNALGLYDMSGNVWEWCQDWDGDYSSSTQTDPQGPVSGNSRIIRGGCWGFSGSSCRVSCRSAYLPSDGDRDIGLRLVLAVEPKAQLFTANGVSFAMVKVPGGKFTMGGTGEQGDEAYSDENPIHSVTLSDYWIGQTEVTQELWTAVMGSNPSKFSGSNLPVEQVSWDDCQEFITRLNALTGKAFRLPTEAEWEYAARDGVSFGKKYAGSNDIDDVAWYGNNSSNTTHTVGTKQPNELGLYDMSGNVAEWCKDWYGDYSSASQTDPQGQASGTYRVLRGGNWGSALARYCRVSCRDKTRPSSSGSTIGLRLVLAGDPTVHLFTVNDVTFTMKEVPGGTFTMGATSEQGSDAYNDENPTHSVTLSSFWIGQTEVTQELWTAVMGSNPSYFSGTNLPVELVSWNDCQEFITKLNALIGETFRLPTEAEWEYAARGAQTGGTKYAGSDNVDDVAWYGNNSSSTTHTVGTKRPNELGLYDMSGNVAEWCKDWYGDYSSASQTDPQGPASGTYRVWRSGNWGGALARYCRVSYRGNSTPSTRSRSLGLRLAR